VIHWLSENAYKITITSRPFAPPCPTCGEELRLASVIPARKSMVYEYLCGNDHVLEFTIGDS
jgi:hypothetical protein